MSRENGTNDKRRQFTPEQNATILRRHLADKVPVSDLCDEYHIQPTLFYLWQRQALEHLSPATVYRVLKAAGLLDRWNGKPSRKGTGFVQPLQPHEHWHIDISYLNLAGTFYYLYLCSILDGATRFLIHWELRERMTTADVETVLQRAREQYPTVSRGPAPHHLRQRPAIHREGLQGIHSPGGDDARPDVAVLPAVEWEARALAPDAQGDDDSPKGAGLARGGTAVGRRLCRVLQSPALAQRDRKLETARARRRALSRQAIEKTASQDVRGSTIVHSPKPNPLSESPIAVH